jgi:hypothetical protein
VNRKCRFTDCLRDPVFPDQPFCEAHRLRFVATAPVRQPEWLRRMHDKGLPAKDMTRSAA